MDIKVSESCPNVSPNFPNANVSPNKVRGSLEENSLKKQKSKYKRIRERRQGIYNLTSWHISRLRKMEERSDDDYGTFIQYIKWKGGSVPIEGDDDFEYLSKLTHEFDNLGGYEFFEKHNLSFPPCGIGGYESTFFD